MERMNGSLGDNPSGMTEVHAFVNELGAGAVFHSYEVTSRLAHIPQGAVSGALNRLVYKLGVLEVLGSVKDPSGTGKRGHLSYRIKQVVPVKPRMKPKACTRNRQGGYEYTTAEAKRMVPLAERVKTLVSEIMERLAHLEGLTVNPLVGFTDLQLTKELVSRHEKKMPEPQPPAKQEHGVYIVDLKAKLQGDES